MDIHPIRSENDYRAALREISAYFDNEPEPGTPEGDRFDILLTLAEAYEAKHFPVDLPDPVESIKFRMEHGWTHTQRPGTHDRANEPGV